MMGVNVPRPGLGTVSLAPLVSSLVLLYGVGHGLVGVTLLVVGWTVTGACLYRSTEPSDRGLATMVALGLVLVVLAVALYLQFCVRLSCWLRTV